MESDMPPIPQAQQPATQNLNVMVPNAQQVLTPQQLLQLQQLQLQYQQQQMLQQQTAQPSIPTPIAPTTAQAPAVTTEKTQSEIHIPEELKMLQDFMHMTGGNVFVAAALVAAALFYKQWKAKNDGKTDNSQLDAHTTACDLERKDLASKLAGLDSKAQKINELENRLGALEEDSERDINLGFSDEIEERLNSIEKQLKELGKAYSSFERRISTAKEPAVPNEVEASDNTSTVKRGRKPSTSK
jgi:hypothetical protein